MGKKKKHRATLREQQAELLQQSEHRPRRQKRAAPLEAFTESQGLYISTILHSDVSFGIGPAGTGKTYVAAVLACEMLDEGKIDGIVLTRPAVDTEDFGALPGEIEDKYAPYLEPFMDVFKERYSDGQIEYMLKSGKISAAPLSFMRGKTFKRKWVLLDEAQNTTTSQMKMALTRIGEGSKLIVSGDMDQNDLKPHIKSGLNDAVQRLQGMPEIGIVEFNRADVVRHGLISKILERYEH